MSIIFAISGNSRSGRSSVAHLVCKLLDRLDLAITYTTRARLTEEPDSDLIFISRETFDLMIEREQFLEYGSSFGNYYGTPSHYLQQARERGNDLVIQVDDRGVEQIKQKIPDSISILILPGQFVSDKLAAGSTPDEMLIARLERGSSTSRMENCDKYDHVFINDGLEDSAKKVSELIRTERSRRP